MPFPIVFWSSAMQSDTITIGCRIRIRPFLIDSLPSLMLAWQFFGMVISIVYREFGLAPTGRYITNMLGKAIGIYRWDI